MFNTFCWYLNRLGLARVATALRFTLYVMLHPFVRENRYSDPEMQSSQYQGWLHVGRTVVAFRRNDGDIQFRW